MPTKLRMLVQVGSRWHKGGDAKNVLLNYYRDYVGPVPKLMGKKTRSEDPAAYFAGLFDALRSVPLGRRMRVKIYRDRRGGGPTRYKAEMQLFGLPRRPDEQVYRQARWERKEARNRARQQQQLAGDSIL